MSVFLQKLIIFFTAISTFFTGLFGINTDKIKPYSVPEGSAVSVQSEALYEAYGLPEFTAGDLQGIYESSGETVIGRYENTEEADFNAYVSALTNAGFDVYDRNTIEDNVFATLTNGESTVSVSRFTRTKTLRIIAEPKGALCPLTDKRAWALSSALRTAASASLTAAWAIPTMLIQIS